MHRSPETVEAATVITRLFERVAATGQVESDTLGEAMATLYDLNEIDEEAVAPSFNAISHLAWSDQTYATVSRVFLHFAERLTVEAGQTHGEDRELLQQQAGISLGFAQATLKRKHNGATHAEFAVPIMQAINQLNDTHPPAYVRMQLSATQNLLDQKLNIWSNERASIIDELAEDGVPSYLPVLAKAAGRVVARLQN